MTLFIFLTTGVAFIFLFFSTALRGGKLKSHKSTDVDTHRRYAYWLAGFCLAIIAAVPVFIKPYVIGNRAIRVPESLLSFHLLMMGICVLSILLMCSVATGIKMPKIHQKLSWIAKGSAALMVVSGFFALKAIL